MSCKLCAARAVQQNTGMRKKPMPGARMRRIVVTKLSAPMIEETPERATAVIHRPWPLIKWPSGFWVLTGG